MMTSAWPMLTSSLTWSTLTQSTVSGQRSQVGPTGQSAGLTDRWDPRVSAVKNKKKNAHCRAESLHGLLYFLGLLGRTRPDSFSSPFSFLFRG